MPKDNSQFMGEPNCSRVVLRPKLQNDIDQFVAMHDELARTWTSAAQDLTSGFDVLRNHDVQQVNTIFGPALSVKRGAPWGAVVCSGCLDRAAQQLGELQQILVDLLNKSKTLVEAGEYDADKSK